MGLQATIEYADQLWLSLIKSYPALLRDEVRVQEKRKQLKKKEVTISAFGRHNCGKSSLLNALMDNACLPTDIRNETGIGVKIRHDSNVHPGPCDKACHGHCPRLELETSDENHCIEAQGAETINDSLHSANQKWRQTGVKERMSYVVYGCVPILKQAPSGWTLVLVDTPGFGEANIDHVTALTRTLYSTSTAYIYIMDSGSMEDDVDAKNIQQLYKHDKELFNDGRFVVAISKIDQCFNRRLTQRRRRGERKSDISIQSLCVTAQAFIKSSVNVEPPLDIMIPVSIEWANTARELQKDPTNKDCESDARQFLECYPDQQPQGQGATAMSPQDQASNLERISGILTLEGRLRVMITHCIHIWETSLVKAYTGYLEEAKIALVKHREQQQKESDAIEEMKALYKKYDEAKAILSGMAYVEPGKKAEIEGTLGEKYDDIDVQAAQRLLHGQIDTMIKAFSEYMQRLVADPSKPVLQRDFEKEVKKFIQEEAEPTLSSAQLNMKLEGVGAAFRDALGEMNKLDQEVEDNATKLLSPDWTPGPAYDELRKDRAKEGQEKNIFSDEVLQMKQLTLKDLQVRAKAPPMKITMFQRFCDLFRKLFRRPVKPDEERSYDKWGKEMNEAVEALRSDLVQEVDTYISGSLKHWVIEEVLSVEYRNRVKNRVQALFMTYQEAVAEAKRQLDERDRCCGTDDIKAIDEDIWKIITAQKNLQPL